jgi:hypothetical protein
MDYQRSKWSASNVTGTIIALRAIKFPGLDLLIYVFVFGSTRYCAMNDSGLIGNRQ